MKKIIGLLCCVLPMIAHALGGVDLASEVGLDDLYYCKVPYLDGNNGSAGVYRGQCLNDMPHGSGKISYNNGDTIIGAFKNGVLAGLGTYRSAGGNVYEGSWLDGKRHGSGTFKWARGSHYVGEWMQDKKNGRGTYTWSNGNRFEGEFRNDKRYNGKYYTSNGHVYKCRSGKCK